MLSYNQINDIFQTQLGRNATPEEYSKLSSASLNSLTNLQAMGYAPNTPTATPTNVSYDPTNPYTDPNVAAAAQNVANIGTQISAGRDLLSSIPQTIQDQATTGMGLSASQLAAQTRAAEAPITAKLKELGQQYNAAKSTYSATLSAAKQAISQAKSQVSREQSKVLTLAGKVIDLIKNRELDPTNPDTASYLSQIEQSSGGLLPKGFFASITPKTITKNANVPVFDQSGKAIGTTGFPYIDTSIKGYYTKPVPNAGGLTQAAIDQAALQFATTGVMPSIGLGSTGQAAEKRNAIQNRAAELAGGSNIAVNKDILAALSSSLKQQTEYANTVERSLANAENGFQQIINEFNKRGINQYDMPIANIIANAAKYNLGSGDVSAFKAALQEVANEYTQVFSRGGQVSDAVRQRAQDIVDGNISINNLKTVLDELQQQGSIILAGAKNQVQNIQNQMNSLLMNQSQYTSPYSGAFPGITSNNNVSGADYTNLTFTTPDGQVFQFDDANSLRSFVNKINQQYGK
jgi:hypothetical protein